MTHATTFLGMTGDTTIVWEEKEDEKMVKLIQSMMDSGVTFFIVKPRLGGFLSPSKVIPKSINEVMANRAISMEGEGIEFINENITFSVVSSPREHITISRAKTAEEAVKKETVAVRQLKGG